MGYNRLMNDFKMCNEDNDLIQIGCNFGLENNDYYKWRVTMLGPADTPYENGQFTIQVIFPRDYPNHGPEFIFLNKIYHLNVNCCGNPHYKAGHICLNTINQWQNIGKVDDKPFYDIKQALFDIFCLFFNQGTDSPYSSEMAKLFRDNPEEFNKIAKEWTQNYAKFLEY